MVGNSVGSRIILTIGLPAVKSPLQIHATRYGLAGRWVGLSIAVGAADAGAEAGGGVPQVGQADGLGRLESGLRINLQAYFFATFFLVGT